MVASETESSGDFDEVGDEGKEQRKKTDVLRHIRKVVSLL